MLDRSHGFVTGEDTTREKMMDLLNTLGHRFSLGFVGEMVLLSFASVTPH